MIEDTTNAQHRIWHESAHASLCALGVYLRRMDFFRPLEQGVHMHQKVLKYSSVQKLEMFFVGLLAGAKAVSHTATTVRVDPALSAAFGLPGCLSVAIRSPASGRSSGRVHKLVDAVSTWHPTSSPGREVAPVPQPVTFVRPLHQYAVRTPSTEHKGGYYYAVVFTSRTDLSMIGVVEQYDGRAGMEADLKGDKHGLALAVIRKQRLPAQQMVVLLIQLAHHVLLWARQWLAKNAPRLGQYGIVRLVRTASGPFRGASS